MAGGEAPSVPRRAGLMDVRRTVLCLQERILTSEVHVQDVRQSYKFSTSSVPSRRSVLCTKERAMNSCVKQTKQSKQDLKHCH